jgi:mannose-6-phosphate isomerase-like protein (cupin superfamily)
MGFSPFLNKQPQEAEPKQNTKELEMNKVNIADKLNQISEYWRPKVVGELNGQEVKLVKFQGEFVWHHHDLEDELFLGVHGRFRIEFRDRVVTVDPGEFIIVPRGVEHRTVAWEEAHVLLFEPAAVRNTGNVFDPKLTAPMGDKL